MKVYFRNTTAYNLQTYQKFAEFHAKKYNFRYHLYTAFISFLMLFCMILQFCYHYIWLGIGFIVLLAVFLCYRFIQPVLLIKKEATSKKIKQHMTNTYTFYDRTVCIDNGSDRVELRYFKFYKLFEEPDRFYLYLDKTHSYVLLKSNFSIGDANDFAAFIQKRLWKQIG